MFYVYRSISVVESLVLTLTFDARLLVTKVFVSDNNGHAEQIGESLCPTAKLCFVSPILRFNFNGGFHNPL
jgi:hypothetical protein